MHANYLYDSDFKVVDALKFFRNVKMAESLVNMILKCFYRKRCVESVIALKVLQIFFAFLFVFGFSYCVNINNLSVILP